MSRMNCFKIGRFSSVASHGKEGGEGGILLLGHWQGLSDLPGTPLLVQGGKVADILVIAPASMLAMEEEGSDDVSGWQDPMEGKSVGIVCNWVQQFFDRYVSLTWLDT